MPVIKAYRKRQEALVKTLILSEGDLWSAYTDPKHWDTYALNLEKSLTYVLYQDKEAIGYIRALEDYGYYIYVCDLLVIKDQRGHGYGKMLLEHIKTLYPNHTVYVMSDEDGYYEQLGYQKAGHIFLVTQ